ncbi:GNAT family N-acetyltransferase [Leucobacter zeae]|nr:GNAT family N-acetyltransferase [Leucobacter zeae]
MSAGIEIRRVRPEEYAAVGALVRAAYDGDYSLGSDYLAEIEDVAGRDARAEVLVAVDAETRGTEEILGTVTIPLPGERLEDDTADGEMDVRLLGVARAARGRGIGERIMRHVLDVARERGASALALHTGEQMLAPQRLYERMGFARMPDRDFEIDIPGRRLPRRILAYRFPLAGAARTESDGPAA